MRGKFLFSRRFADCYKMDFFIQNGYYEFNEVCWRMFSKLLNGF